MRYVTVTINKIIIQIAKTTDVEGYTIGVLEAFMPDDQTIKNWSEQQGKAWIDENNKRMKAICQFLNDNHIK